MLPMAAVAPCTGEVATLRGGTRIYGRVSHNSPLAAQNVLAMLPMAAVALCAGEVATLRGLEWTNAGIAVVAASCVAGLGMSYFSFALRAAISATSFSVIGNVCKVLTILVNLLMWDKHASARPFLTESHVCLLSMCFHCYIPPKSNKLKLPGKGCHAVLERSLACSALHVRYLCQAEAECGHGHCLHKYCCRAVWDARQRPGLLRADAWGTAGLLACLAAGSFYQQPPMRVRTGKADKEPPAGNAGPELTNPLLGKSPV